MNGPNHLGTALAVPLIAHQFYQTPLPTDEWQWAALMVGSLFPDLENASYITRPGSWLPAVVPNYIKRPLNKVGVRVSKLLKAVLGHRGISHWPELYLLGAWWVDTPMSWWFAVGVCLHWLGDVITIQGAPLATLLGRKVVVLPFLPLLRVGGKRETLVGFAAWMVAIGLPLMWWLETTSGLLR